MRSVVWHWKPERAPAKGAARWRNSLGFGGTWEWEGDDRGAGRRRLGRFLARLRRPLIHVFIFAALLLAGVRVAAGPESALANLELRRALDRALLERQRVESELELLRLESARMQTVMGNSARYGIPADLAAEIYDIALAEGIEPDLAYRLVRVESEFYPRAISSAGAVGLTQLMPSTAYELEPRLRYSDLFDRKTNLHLGFRYLRLLIEQYRGDLRLALLAYNRGPGTVEKLRGQGIDPANGYAQRVLGEP